MLKRPITKLKDLYHADEHFLKFFESNRESVDRSFFFFMADHGPHADLIRETRLGMYENLNPFLMVTIPSQYRNTSIHHQLYHKANELMTNFDLHATIVDILKEIESGQLLSDLQRFFQLQPTTRFSDTSYRDLMPLSKGSSLFREWRGARNCRTLPIPSAYCICHYNDTTVNDEVLMEKLGKFFAEQVNQILYDNGVADKCQKYKYFAVGEL
uniref:Sulfatase domain-containing protein n=1 Tax=Angiostrongylus cantonensis TaxID=6313 RepID=A0A0K0D809_ANGCA